jgi:hypothetical protein
VEHAHGLIELPLTKERLREVVVEIWNGGGGGVGEEVPDAGGGGNTVGVADCVVRKACKVSKTESKSVTL